MSSGTVVNQAMNERPALGKRGMVVTGGMRKVFLNILVFEIYFLSK